MGQAEYDVPRALLHNIPAEDTRERPLNMSFEKVVPAGRVVPADRVDPMLGNTLEYFRDDMCRYVVPTGRVVVSTGRVVVPTGRVISPGRIPTGRYVVPTGRVVVPTGRVFSPGRIPTGRVILYTIIS
nr:hypothetical protein [Tanacetum cinerariifolium]